MGLKVLGLAAAASFALLASVPAVAEDAPAYPPFTEEEEALYLQRLNTLAQAARLGAGLDMYDPLETVAGVAPYAPLPTAAAPTIAPDALAAAVAYADASNANAFIVWRRGAIEAEAYFDGFDRDAPIVSRSLAKPLTALAIGRAIALGAIQSLDQPVADFITEWRGTEKAPILVRHLLDQRTGLLPQGFDTTPESVLNRAYLHPRHEDIIIHEYPLTDPPGSVYEYSNVTSELVAIVIERATGRRYSEFLSTEVIRAIGAQGGEVWVNRPGGLAHSGCCILLPAQTWLRMAILLIQDGVWEGERLLPEGYVAEMRTATAENPHYGLGVFVAGDYIERRGSGNPRIQMGRSLHSEPYLAEDLFLFDGNGNQAVYIVPSADLIILRTGPRPPQPPEAPEWDNTWLPNTLIRAIQWGPGESPPTPQAGP